MEHALAGIKVANFCWSGAGPISIRYLAYHGATVVRVESHRRPDIIRLMVPFKGRSGDPNCTPWFANINTSQYGVSIDLSNPHGLAIAWKLIEWADVVAEGFVAGTMKQWGLDYESVVKRRSDIIYISTSSMGQTGPAASFRGWGYQNMARAGFTHLSGWPDRGPAPTQSAYTDYTAPRFNATAVLAALDYRRRTGIGQYIDSSQSECSIHLLAPVLMDYAANGNVMNRDGNRAPSAAPHGVYPCQGDDRWCAIAVSTEEQWQSFCRVVGRPEWLGDALFATFAKRKEQEDLLNELVAEWTFGRTAEEVEQLLQRAGVPASVVADSSDLFRDSQLRHRSYFTVLKHSAMGEHTYRGIGYTMSETPPKRLPGPMMGEHNEYVFKELLGMSDDEIGDALADGGITTDADLPDTSVSSS